MTIDDRPGCAYFFAAASVAVGLVIILAGRRALRRVDDGPESTRVEAEAISAGEVS